MLPAVRKHLPGFLAMEHTLVKWLNDFYNTNVELFYAHGLRQGPHTLKSTGFDVHQDTEDFDFIEFTVVVKLTPDGEGEPPSAMRVVGASRRFHYGAAAGSAGAFRARLHHASVAPKSSREHLKIAFFFRQSIKGDRLAQRQLGGRAGADIAADVEELLAQLTKGASSAEDLSPVVSAIHFLVVIAAIGRRRGRFPVIIAAIRR